VSERPLALITGANGDIARAIRADVEKDHSVFAASYKLLDIGVYGEVKDYMDTIGRVDLLINTAGYIHPQTVKNSAPDIWLDEIMTNLVGPYYLARECLKRGCKLIINMGSSAAKEGKPEWSGYCAAKRGLVSLTESLHAEGHKAYCLNIGRTNTKMRKKLYGNEDPDTLLSPKDVAKVVRHIIENKPKQPIIWYYKEYGVDYIWMNGVMGLEKHEI
jgi:NAD(P)-dependent dehydrogenase (short-subunit alcohol dehydrogenase family)